MFLIFLDAIDVVEMILVLLIEISKVLRYYFNFLPSLSNVYVGILYENEKGLSVNPLLITPRNYAFLRIMFMLTAQRILSRIFLKATMHKIYVFAHTQLYNNYGLMHNMSIHHFTRKSKLRQAQIMHFLIICKSEFGIGTLRKIAMNIILLDLDQKSKFTQQNTTLTWYYQ